MSDRPEERAARAERDPRLAASRYSVDRLADDVDPDDVHDAGAPTTDQQAAIIETTIQQAIRRGDFDDLPGAGKPLKGLGGRHDPDWWIRRKIETEQLSGLGPPALSLRTENAELDARLDRMHREQDVRDALADFNKRVVDARRQLQGGPPVVTPTRDVEAELRAWSARRAERLAAAAAPRAADTKPARNGWFRRRRDGGPATS